MAEIVAKDQLKQYIDRIERLETEKSALLDDIKQVFDEAKANGFDVKTMKQIIKLRKLDKNKLAEQDAILELYRQALEV
ncbi:MAG: DUF2312 domain-containing protein [Rickettsiaceae bacterium]|jgi:uncharacterized protein (UPF0335 family)|uniref:DUF2312 domain-containing protein n=1 Tax=Candidatus Megaera polyxenophila TaxID=988779 RepID=UPI001B67F21B|nr:DUF2312 domain-containing protein [Candidatus Megaera polyxenophila]MBP9778431.1 DUF2312 domain-containing protein [Rickettsiaceae bacterium]MBU6184071.1 DUF2312 domain-containing protein [Rickettsiales bacterium]NBY35698.1 DUF2312 domain-containing protein [Alphaproteobacteria bacterium]UCM93887.1 MAG: DUF2312 domain-containing protein [Candidatus Megaira endosymbiont of Mesostigma viride]HJK85179.1 DUF2312 domain-containing protein [Candidatus Megaera endosymbiont of Stentor roeselii]